jgi:diguanylate cyclase (GGDEF)-like protein
MHFIQVVTEELEQTNRELTQLSLTDHLTQIHNRVKLDAVMAEEMARATRYQYTFSVILLDIDHFKHVNDTHGHIVGDAVLVRLACILKKHIRENDTLGRWGGEEFLLILPHTDLDRACALAEKLRQTIEAEVFPVAGYKTCSFGITSCYPGDNMTRLLARADHALYEAKNLGRNRVQVQEPSGRG